MKVKICGMAEKNNLKEIINLKPDILGFIFYPVSPRYMAQKLQPEDLTMIPSKIRKAGVFVDADLYELEGICWKYNLDYVQLHGNESADFCKRLNSSGISIIKAFQVGDLFDFSRVLDYISSCRYFLFDNRSENYGGSGRKFDWKILSEYKAGHPFFISGGIGPWDADDILQISHPSFVGVDLNSRFEVSPGIKDYRKLEDFLTKLRRA